MGSRRALVVATAALAVLAFAPVAAGKIVLRHDTFGGVYRSPGGAVAAGTPVRLRLSVSGALATRVLLRVEVADPVAGTSRLSNLRMRRLGALWTVTYRTPTKPAIVTYSFRVTVGRRTLWYGDDNSGADVTKGGTGRMTSTRGDAFRITIYARGFTTPAWLQGAVVYSIFPDRFRNGDPTNDYCRAGATVGCPTFYGNVPALLHPTWNEPLEDSRATGVFNRDFFGGDLQGVTEMLDHLKFIGVDAIWLTPIFKARSNHRYDTDDYLQVDPALGGDAAFAQLSAAAKARGIHLILDGVFNHTSSDSRYFDRYSRYPEILGACESPSSPFRSWYEIRGTEVPCTNYSGFANLDTLPTLNDESQAVRDFVYRGSDSVIRHWVTRGADGWRLDVAHELSHPWWRDFRTAVKGYAPDTPLIGEITAGPVDATEYLFGDELDGVMNYRFRQIANGFARQTAWTDSSGTIPPLRPSQAAHALQAIYEDYPKQAAAVSFNLVDSHDTNRALSVLTEPGDTYQVATERQQLVALLQFTAFGAPMVYYGDEAGIDAPGRSGFGDPYNRAPYPWADASGNVDTYGPPADFMLSWYTRLGALRRSLPALRAGSLVTLFAGDTTGVQADNSVYAFARVALPDKPVIVVLNKGNNPAQAAIPLRGLYVNGTELEQALGGAPVAAASGRVVVSVGPRSGLVLVGTS
jgi:glycosidase